MKFKNFILILIALWISLALISGILNQTIFYDLEVRNCELILQADYLNPTEKYSNCVGIINYPVYNYFIEGWILSFLLSLLAILMVGFVIGVYIYLIGGFD